VGTSAASAPSDSIIPASVPDAPTDVLATASDGQVVLSWTAPIWNGGSAITDYVIEYKLTSEPTVWLIFADGTSTQTIATVTGLTNDLSYDFRISAVNIMGRSGVNSASATLPANIIAPTNTSHGGGGYLPKITQPQVLAPNVNQIPTEISSEKTPNSPKEAVKNTNNNLKITNKKSGVAVTTPGTEETTPIPNVQINPNQNSNQVQATPTKVPVEAPIFTETKTSEKNLWNSWYMISSYIILFLIGIWLFFFKRF
jgi:hypothetical protein